MPSPIVAATLQAAGLSTASNLFAQLIQARQEKVRTRCFVPLELIFLLP